MKKQAGEQVERFALFLLFLKNKEGLCSHSTLMDEGCFERMQEKGAIKTKRLCSFLHCFKK